MIDFHDPDQLQAFLLEQIRRKSELPKLDFKRELQWSSRRERLNVLKDLNAIANTFEREFNDWGFIIFGMERRDGAVTREVAAFKELGADKLEAQVGQMVQSSMKPAPRFRAFEFVQEGVGVWGAFVIEPSQPGPVVFAQKGTVTEQGRSQEFWQVGDWFLRRAPSVTDRPHPEDYTQMIRGQIAAAVFPLQSQIDQLKLELARVEGRLEETSRNAHARIEVDLHDASGMAHPALRQVSTAQLSDEATTVWQEHLRRVLGAFLKKERQVLIGSPLLAALAAMETTEVIGPSSEQNLPETHGIVTEHRTYSLVEARELIENEIGQTDDSLWSFVDLQRVDVRVRSRFQLSFPVSYIGEDGMPRFGTQRQEDPVRQEWRGEEAHRLESLRNALRQLQEKSAFLDGQVFEAQLVGISARVSNRSSRPTGQFRLEWVSGLPLYQDVRENPQGHPTRASLRQVTVMYSGTLHPEEASDSRRFYVLTADRQDFSLELRALGEHLGGAQQFKVDLGSDSVTETLVDE